MQHHFPTKSRRVGGIDREIGKQLVKKRGRGQFLDVVKVLFFKVLTITAVGEYFIRGAYLSSLPKNITHIKTIPY